MAPKRATRSTPVTTTPAPTATTTTSVTNAQLQAIIDQGVTATLAVRDAKRNGDDSHTSGTGGRRTERVERDEKDQVELWSLKVKGTDVIGYNQRFQELALLCVRMFSKESDKIERYVGGLPDMIYGNIIASKPKTMQEAVEMATKLIDKKVSTIAERQDENKRKFETLLETIKTNKNRTRGRTLAGLILQGPVKRSHTGDLKPYALNATITTTVCMLQNATNATNLAILPVTIGVQEMPTMLTIREALDSNVVTGTFLLNNRYASILFDTGADRSFVSTAFSSQMDITPSTLDHYYDVELADGRIIGLNTILRGCTLNLLNHPFNINLMPVELGSFDAIIGMDWLVKYQAIIVCAEKIIHIPWGNETLIVHGDGSNQGHEARLHIISYSKTQEYMLKGCPVFLAHVTTKEVEDKSEKKRLEDVPIVQDFPEVFPEDLPGLPPTRQVEFKIDLIPGAAPESIDEREISDEYLTDGYLTKKEQQQLFLDEEALRETLEEQARAEKECEERMRTSARNLPEQRSKADIKYQKLGHHDVVNWIE
ncbi:putative reverse transcriptase domain-containing protein [Tanacetum coccineum]